MNSLKILMVVPQYPFPIVGGLEKQAQLLSTELVRMGHQVCALSGRITPEQPALTIEQGVEIHRLPWPRNRLYRWTLLWPLAITRMIQLTRKSDVVHAHNYSGFGLLAIIVAKLCQKPIIVKLPNFGDAGLPGFVKSSFGQTKLQIFKRATAIVAMSVESLIELAAIGYDSRRVLATPNGIHCVQLKNQPAYNPDNLCRIVFIGRLVSAKGLPILLDAVDILLKQTPKLNFSLDIYGDGPEYSLLKESIHEKQLSKAVQLRGHHDQAAKVLVGYDVLVLPSYREGNSNVILEAMAAGVPVVSTRVGGTPMLLGPEGGPWMHEPGDAQALSNLLEQLISDVQTREQLGALMRRRVEQKFDMRVVAGTYEAAYRKLAEGKEHEVADLSNPIVTMIQ